MYLRHLSTEYRSIPSADMSAESRPIYRPILSRYVGRVSVDTLFKLIDGRSTLSVGISWISFCFCVTDLGFAKRTSVKKPCSVTVCTVGKLSSVGVQVTSSVVTVPGIRKPTSLYKPYRVTVI